MRAFISLISFLCGLATFLPAPRASGADPSADDSRDSKFLRFVADKDGGGGTLQASTVRYENADGVTLDLVAAVHIADASFFKALDASFDDYDAVLYEMVAPSEMLSPTTRGSTARRLRDPSASRPATRRRPQRSLAVVGGLQRTLKETLQLSFQLDAIDYHRTNFVHADLDAETFARMQDDRGESLFTLMLNSMLRQMSDPRAMAGGPGIGDILFALRSPDKARELKLLLARQFNRLDEQMSGMEGPNGSVILSERNKAALDVLKQQLAANDHRSIAIFYGAAHLKGMETSLTQELGFHQVGPPFWRVAWDMSGAPAASTRPTTHASRATTRASGH